VSEGEPFDLLALFDKGPQVRSETPRLFGG
jgi:hypothetical protein